MNRIICDICFCNEIFSFGSAADSYCWSIISNFLLCSPILSTVLRISLILEISFAMGTSCSSRMSVELELELESEAGTRASIRRSTSMSSLSSKLTFLTWSNGFIKRVDSGVSNKQVIYQTLVVPITNHHTQVITWLETATFQCETIIRTRLGCTNLS